MFTPKPAPFCPAPCWPRWRARPCWPCQPLWVLYLEYIMAKKLSMIRAIFFDVGETLVDESRQWRLWADWLGVSHLTFFAAFGAVLERGEHHRRVFDYFVPNIDLAQASQNREAAGVDYKSNCKISILMPCRASRRCANRDIWLV